MYRLSLLRISSFAAHFKDSLDAAGRTRSRGAQSPSSAEEAGSANAAPQLATGAPFNNVTFKPFPVRAAIDVNNGQVTLAVARVDARQRAIRDLLFQSQLPFHVEFESGFAEVGGGGGAAPVRMLTQASQNDLLTKCRVLIGSMHREGPGITEVAGLLAWPFYELHDGGAEIARAMTVALKVDFRVVGQSNAAVKKDPRAERLERLRQRAAARKGGASSSSSEEEKAKKGEGGVSTALVPMEGLSPEEELNQLAFLAIAAGAKVVDRTRMVAVVEQPATLRSPDGAVTSQFCGGAIQLVGTIDKEDIAEAEAAAGGGHEAEGEHEEMLGMMLGVGGKKASTKGGKNAQPAAAQWAPLQRFQLPIDTMGAHSMLLRDVQRRDEGLLHSFSSPNPVHRREAEALRNGLCRMLMPQMPSWVRRKLENGGVMVGASENGGLLNIAARLVGKPNVGADTLEQNVDYSMCGLTDVLIGHSLPTPQLIVPQACLAVAMMASSGATRLDYIPRTSLAQAVLVHPAYWAYSRRAAIEEALEKDLWYSSERQRTYSRPASQGMKHDPNGHLASTSFLKRTPSIARY